MSISLSNETIERLVALFKESFPKGATSGVVEIFRLDDYAEYPIVYRSSSGEVVTPVFNGWDSPESIASDNLTKFLSDEISDLSNNIDKQHPDYWNHFLFILSKDGSCDYNFSYSPDIPGKFESEFRQSIGDELYEKYERERNIDRPIVNEESNFPGEQALTDGERESMTVNELLSFIHQEMICDLPDDWEAVNIDVKYFLENGKQAISTKNTFKKVNSAEWHEFSTSNVFGPMNATLEIRNIMASQGDVWSKAKVSLFSNGKIKLETE